ncbi:MAG: hypothetical protein LBL48_03730 [Azoarcus sp.]|jgi:hypothetical protein|nr:hypothetical protein [Azoarcus sp.]
MSDKDDESRDFVHQNISAPVSGDVAGHDVIKDNSIKIVLNAPEHRASEMLPPSRAELGARIRQIRYDLIVMNARYWWANWPTAIFLFAVAGVVGYAVFRYRNIGISGWRWVTIVQPDEYYMVIACLASALIVSAVWIVSHRKRLEPCVDYLEAELVQRRQELYQYYGKS